ncbi:hypothetical protein [Bradyrhizobium sp. CB3481]|uniref:tetratricopeptide repeat protein n=1 Tax=Bradyrhizobium sp. CB3481 TaxID=3039158 RepID=UPI0024B146A3|nr:hypothetical protein [Bradyrhizobium sp. CB3481]WFU16437.1 hypothetical protein QA643_36765 [Bradyrhizobium sp. CB3481]
MTDGRLEVRTEAYKPVFLDTLRVYPGTKVELEVISKVDAMSRMYETRECWSKWFGGIWCEYIKRTDGSGMGADRVPLMLELFEGPQDGSAPMSGATRTNPARVKSESDEFDASSHLPANTGTFTIDLDDASIQDNFTRGFVLKGRVATRYNAGGSYPSLVRNPCAPHRNGEYCSQGQFIVKLKAVDTTAREKMFERYLARKRSYGEISSPGVIDYFMKHEIKNGQSQLRPKLVNVTALLMAHARTHYQLQGGARDEDLRQILELAVSLDPGNPDARNELVRYHIETGSLSQAKAEGGETLRKFSEAYSANPQDRNTLKGFAQALRNAGQIFLRDRAATDLQDVETANGFYERSLKIWAEYQVQAEELSDDERTQIAQVQVDQARILQLIRSKPALERATTKLEDARRFLPRVGRGMVTAVSSDRKHFLTSSFFQPLAEVGKAQVLVGLLPSGGWKPIGTVRTSGRLLMKRPSGDSSLEYGYWAPSSPKSVEQFLMPGVSFLSDVRPYRAGELVGVDSSSGDWVATDGGKLITLEKSIEKTALWDAAESSPVTAFTDGKDASKIKIVRNGKSFLIETSGGATKALSLSPSGRFVQFLQMSGNDGSLTIVDLSKLEANSKQDASNTFTSKLPNELSLSKPLSVFSADERFATTILGDEFLLICMTDKPSNSSILRLPHETKGLRLEVVGDSYFALLPTVGETVSGIALLDGEELSKQGKDLANWKSAAAAPLLNMQFQSSISTQGLTISSFNKATKTTTLLVEKLPAVLHVHSIQNGQLWEARIAGARYEDAVLLPGGEHMLLRDEDERIRIVNRALDTLHDFSGAKSSKGLPINEIIPIAGAVQGGFFRVERDATSGEVVRVSTYSSAKSEPKVYQFPSLASIGGKQQGWRLLKQPTGHLTPDQARLTLVPGELKTEINLDPGKKRSDYDSLYQKKEPQTVAIIQIHSDGTVQTSKVDLREPDRILAKVGGAFIEARETGLAFVSPGEQDLTYLDDCGPSAVSDGCSSMELKFAEDGQSVISVRQNGDALDVTGWKAAVDGNVSIAWKCKVCVSVNQQAYEPLVDRFAGARPSTLVAATANGRLLAPYKGGLGSGLPTDATWSRKLPLGSPITVTDEVAMIQRETMKFELWRNQ